MAADSAMETSAERWERADGRGPSGRRDPGPIVLARIDKGKMTLAPGRR